MCRAVAQTRQRFADGGRWPAQHRGIELRVPVAGGTIGFLGHLGFEFISGRNVFRVLGLFGLVGTLSRRGLLAVPDRSRDRRARRLDLARHGRCGHGLGSDRRFGGRRRKIAALVDVVVFRNSLWLKTVLVSLPLGSALAYRLGQRARPVKALPRIPRERAVRPFLLRAFTNKTPTGVNRPGSVTGSYGTTLRAFPEMIESVSSEDTALNTCFHCGYADIWQDSAWST
jgi:hypothetical protein